ncbi:hypothetical protein OBBRIDRAFT_794632 [Obba rivulosa]|uniref:Uncharacterized protein n=1 Tax=Obba rivulosa TaxID=1052685 RepID=A0A8E2DKN8_9APHY|nr:hypothetical protein OBBRIDRAFT_794632 [Obba rivulosa]
MATRQNKKRKGRNNAINRERTVTTLTEGPESSFLIPTPTEEPAGSIMSSPFSIASGPGNPPNMPPPGFAMNVNPGFAPFPYNNVGYIQPMSGPTFGPQHPPMGPPPQQFFHQPPPPQQHQHQSIAPNPSLPPGQSDLEVLEKLKQQIKNGQHEFFRAVPQPLALANLYLGPQSAPAQAPVQPPSEPPQQVQDRFDTSKLRNELPSAAPAAATNGSAVSGVRGAPQPSEAREGPKKPSVPSAVSEPQPPPNVLPASSPAIMPYPANIAFLPSQNASVASAVPPRISRFDESAQRHISASGPAPAPASAVQPQSAQPPAMDGKPSAPSGVPDSSQRPPHPDSAQPSSARQPPPVVKQEPLSAVHPLSERSPVQNHVQAARQPGEISPAKSSVSDSRDEVRPRDWYRNGQDDKPRYGNGNGIGHHNGNGLGNNYERRGFYDREKERERDRDRDRDWERERDRRDPRGNYDRFRDERRDERPRPFDRRGLPLPDSRHYDSRYDNGRKYDPKGPDVRSPPEDRGPPPRSAEDRDRPLHRTPPDSSPTRAPVDDRRPMPPPAADERPPRPPVLDDRRPVPPPAADERPLRPPILEDRRGPAQPPLSSSDRQMRPSEDRRVPPSPVANADRVTARPPPPEDRRPPAVEDRRAPGPPPASSAGDRPVRPLLDDRRPPAPLPPSGDRPLRPEERRSPPGPLSATASGDRSIRPGEERRLIPPSPVPADRQVRPADERRAPPLPIPANLDRARPPPMEDRQPLLDDRRPPVDDRRPPFDDRRPPPPTADRQTRPTIDVRRAPIPPSEDRAARPATGPSAETAPVRPPPVLEERGARPPEDRPPRAAVPLEERISRVPPTLQERLGHPPVSAGRPDDRHAHPPTLEERLSRPPPTLEERLLHPPAADERTTHSGPPSGDDRLARPPPSALPPSVSDRGARPTLGPGPADDRSILLAEPARLPPPADRTGRPDDHGRPSVSDRFMRPPSPVHSERGPRPGPFIPARAASVARDSSRPPYKPSHSPVRADIRDRDFRPTGEPPRDRVPYRPEPDRFTDRRSDMMDVDPPATRFAESRPPYRRPSPPPPPPDSYPARTERGWVPNDTYAEEPRRPPVDSHSFNRDWRPDERRYDTEWDRSWERPSTAGARDCDRDTRYPEREAGPPHGWETREERERRVSGTFAAPEPPAAHARPFEQRSLGARLSDAYPADDRGYPRELDRDRDRPRYPPVDASPPVPTFSRVRPRSPSPVRRGGPPVDDMRPPVKRARDDTYGGPSGYYPPAPVAAEPPRGGPPGDYAPRMRTPPPAGGGGAYYDNRPTPAGAPYGTGAPPRDREYVDRERAPDVGGYGYERREPMARMPPPRSPPSYGRGGYGRPGDDRRYSMPPRA